MVACHLRQDATGDTGMDTTLSNVQDRKFSLRSFGPLFERGIALLPVPSYQLGGGLWYWLGPGLFFWCCFPPPAPRREWPKPRPAGLPARCPSSGTAGR